MSVTVTKTEQTVEVTQGNQTVTLTPVTQTITLSAAGPQGASGTNGQGVPVGGTTGQVLAKINATDYNTQWVAQSGGVTSVTGTAPIVSSGGTTPAISVSAASTSSAGVVQLSDSTSTTSSILAATPTAVKAAYDRGSTGVTDAATAQATATAAVPKAVVDAKGDLLAASAADTVTRLPVGTNTYVLTADSAETTGLKWAAPATGTVTSVTGTAPIVSSGGATPAISIAAATTAVVGAVQLSDSTSTTSSVLAATPTAVKAAYDLAGTKVGSVTGTAPIVSSGGTTPAISVTAASTSASGVVQLSDSVSTTSSVLAATPTAVKSTYDIATAGWEAFTFGTAGVIATVPRFMLTTTRTPLSGQIHHSKIVPHRDFTVTNIAMVGTSAASVPTLIRFGIYTRSGTTFTLVARTASDTSIFAAANTKYTRALNTTGGYPATYTMTAGAEYWVSVIQVASTPAVILAATTRDAGAVAATGAQLYTDSGESDLSTPSTSVANTTLGVYAEVS
jgi:hypothetical protein